MNQSLEVSSTSTSDKLVTMSNALIRSGQGLTLVEKRVVMLAVSKLNPKKAPATPVDCVTRVTVEEYVREYGADPDSAYKQVKEATKHLYNRTITFFEPAYRRKGKALTYIEVNMRWVGEARYHKGEGWVELHWWHKIVPHLMGLKAQFTTYQLQQASALRSVYSWRLLELLSRFQATGWAQYDIDDFCASMEATEKQKSDFNYIKRRMIEPAIKELIEKDGWEIDWQPVKAGRKVQALRFTFSRSTQQSLF